MNTRQDDQTRISIIGTRGYPSFYGGFETAVRQLAPYLSSRQFKVDVYGRRGSLLAKGSTSTFIRSIVTPGINSRSLSTLSYGFFACIHAFFSGPKIALVMNVANGYWLPILRLRGIRVVVNVDGIEWQRAKWGPIAKAVFRFGARLTARFANEIICDSKAIQIFWEQHFGVKTTYIPYGGQECPKLPSPFGLPRRSFALMVARFVPENSVSEFLEAAKIIAESFPVVIVGSSGSNEDIDSFASELAARNKNIYSLGHISDDQVLFALMQNAGVYFHGHTVGGTNPALVQAMHCGSPIIARDTVFNREVLENACFTYTNNNPVVIADACLQLLTNQEQQNCMASRAKARAQSAYRWTDVCAAYETVLVG